MTVEQVTQALRILESIYPKLHAPVVSLIAEKGHDPFKILVSTVLSLRTKDEVTAQATRRLFQVIKTPRDLLVLDEKRLAQLIYPVGFYRTKARNLKEIARELIEKYNGQVPDEMEALLSLPGVGRKTANLVLIEAYDKPGICVDTHVHRISNRWGLVNTATPEQTELALRKVLPQNWWKRYNKLLVAFGQTICRPVKPRCEECPINYLCDKVGVIKE